MRRMSCLFNRRGVDSGDDVNEVFIFQLFKELIKYLSNQLLTYHSLCGYFYYKVLTLFHTAKKVITL